MASTSHAIATPGKFVASNRLKTIYAVCITIGVIAMGMGLVSKDHDLNQRMWFAYLTAFFFFFNLAMGGMFFASLQHVTNAGWSVTLRRISESFTSFLPYAAGAAILLLVGGKSLYEWLRPEVMSHDHILQAKSAYLNFGFFAGRIVAFFALWMLFAKWMIGNSIAQDQSGDQNLTHRNVGISIAFLIVFALSYSLFSVDTIMSLQPHWFSTIFGIYCFAGLFQSTIATIILLTVYLMRKGLLRGLVNDHHLHDMGKYMKAFTVFYAYIGFSQFMLIWYANLPEETIFYLDRSQGGWWIMSWSLLVLKFAAPFLLLLPKWAKRSVPMLVSVAILILVMQYIDIYWLVYPNFDGQIHFGFLEIGAFLGFMGVFLWTVAGFLSRNNIVPVKDPRLHEAVAHTVTY